MDLQTCYRYDEDGYFVGEVLCQIDESGLLLAADSTTVAPDTSLLETNYLKWNGSSWVAEAKPTTAAECAALGDLSHESQTDRIHELRKLFDSLCEGSSEYRVEQDPETLAKRVVAIPPEEGVAQEADKLVADFDAQVASLKDRLATATLMGDDDEVAAIKEEFQTLLAETAASLE